MREIRTRPRLVALALVVIAAAAVSATFALRSGHELVFAHALQKGDPDAQPTVGRANNLGSPDSYAAEQLGALAYPADSLKASLLTNERQYYYTHITKRQAASRDTWQQIGPTTATQPAVLNFFDDQQSDFQVSGRDTAMAVDPSCNTHTCRLWVAAAGGGVWRTDNALASNPSWKFLSASFGTNAIGTLTYDAASHTLYAGTGEPNASGDSESGVGIYASQDGGNTWTLLPGSVSTMTARSISSIVVDPNNPSTLYVGTARGVRGVSSVTGGAVSLAPDAAPWGLWKSTDGGQTFTQVWDGAGSIRGVNHVEMDSHGTIYAAAFQEGIWRSSNGGSSWEQVFATKDAGNNAARTEFALNTTSDGHTRIYVGDGGSGGSTTGVYRGDAIDTKSAASLVTGGTDGGYTSLTSSDRTNPLWGTYDYCEGQCWYDNYVVSPAGHPDIVYVGGSFDYGLYDYADTGKAVLLSTDAGNHWSDETRDASSPSTGIHPDQHALVTDPANPLLFFEGSDGGVVHSSGHLTDNTGFCPTGFGSYTTACLNLLTAVPTKITTMNQGLPTLQFQSVSTSVLNPTELQGGTQDNGTWDGLSTTSSWYASMYGDGGQSAFDVGNPAFRMNEFYGPYTDVNFRNGDPATWAIGSAPLVNSGEATAFYKPQINDPAVSGTMFIGGQSVWRTQDFDGDQAYLEANCPEFTTSAAQPGCGDIVALGDPTGQGGPGNPGDLTSTNYGGDRAGGYVVAIARTPSDHSTMWVATATGRVFVSHNADAPAASVSFTRIDTLSNADPNRFVSGIVIDPTNANRAWVTYTGYNANTPLQPGHVFQVDYDPVHGTATWTDIDNGTGPLGDLPVTGIARNDATGTLYVATDFAVLSAAPSRNGTFNGNWNPAAFGMPDVEVAGVTINQKTHTLYAATHGLGIFKLNLPYR